MSSAAPALPDRQLVLDRYRPLRPLGSGGSGSVWLARDEETGLDVALKIVPREGKAAARAEREAEAAARLRHRRCLRAYGFGSDLGHVYIAYEYVGGRTLRDAMRAGELPDADAVEAAAQILEGLAHAHTRGIIHRDVKPANVLLADDGRISVRLLDFGLAQFDEAETLTAVGDVPGTLAYIAPERLSGEEATSAADVWGVGVLLWEALVGTHPFRSVPLQQMVGAIGAGVPPLAPARPDLPKRLIAAVDRALDLDPRRRPSAGALATELRAALTDRRRPKTKAALRRPRPHLPHLPHIVPRIHAPAVELHRLETRVAPAAVAALAAGAGAAILPFYPSGWAVGIGLAAGAAAFARPRIGLAVALLAPVFPLGNLALGAGIAYAAAAVVWLALCWRDARAGLAFLAGVLLAPFGLLPLAAAAAQVARGPVRRAAHAAAAVIVASLAAGLAGRHLPFGAGTAPQLGLAGVESPVEVLGALWGVLAGAPALGIEALVIGAVAAGLPYARRLGIWGAAGLGAILLAGTVLAAPHAAALPLVACAWLLSAGLTARTWR